MRSERELEIIVNDYFIADYLMKLVVAIAVILFVLALAHSLYNSEQEIASITIALTIALYSGIYGAFNWLKYFFKEYLWPGKRKRDIRDAIILTLLTIVFSITGCLILTKPPTPI